MSNRGFIINAQNSGKINYVLCAEVLAQSIRRAMPGASVTLLTDTAVVNNHFDHVVVYPYGDQCSQDTWKLANDWQVFYASPYTETIKLEADMYVPRSIEHWFDMLAERDVAVCTTIRDSQNRISRVRDYRATVDRNRLPDTYNAVTYFQRTEPAEQFFETVRHIFQNWELYTDMLKITALEPATTDVVYAMASALLGPENTTWPGTEFSMIHLKQAVLGTQHQSWHQELVYEVLPQCFRIQSVPQLYPIHYHAKEFANQIREQLGE